MAATGKNGHQNGGGRLLRQQVLWRQMGWSEYFRNCSEIYSYFHTKPSLSFQKIVWCHKELRQFWRQKRIQPGTDKVFFVACVWQQYRAKYALKVFLLNGKTSLFSSKHLQHFSLQTNFFHFVLWQILTDPLLQTGWTIFAEVDKQSDQETPECSTKCQINLGIFPLCW